MAKINFNKRVYNVLNYKVSKDIMNSPTATREIRKEINRVFRNARRRIDNLQSAGVASPALAALNPDLTTFRVLDKDFNALKIEYARAIEFLQKPTSALEGARIFEQDLLSKSDKDINIEDLRKYFNDKQVDDKFKNFVENYLAKYTSIIDDYRQAVDDISEQIEQAAKEPIFDGQNKLGIAAVDDVNRLFKNGPFEDAIELTKALNDYE